MNPVNTVAELNNKYGWNTDKKTDYKVFKALKGRKTYVVVEKDLGVTKESAIKTADKHFKVGVNNLECESGKVIGDDLYLERTPGRYPLTMCVLNYEVWVVTRK